MIHVSPAHKIIGVPVTDGLRNLFPQAKVVDFQNVQTILLPHGVTETVMLRNLGVDAPAPIMSQYNWPGGKQPFRVQMLTCSMLTTNQRAYCLNGMGTGKTKCLLWSFDFLRSCGLAKRMLVTAPLSTLDNVWRSEAFRTVPHLKVRVLHGTKERRLRLLAEEADIYIINPDGIGVIINELMKREGLDTWAIDEIAVFRNAKSTRNKLACQLAQRMNWIWGATGSPTPHEPTDAYGQCKIVTPHTIPKYFTHFREELMTKVSPFQWVPRKNAIQRVYEVMQPAVRFTLDDVVELPPMIERTIDLAMTKKQTEIYEEIRKNAYAAIAGHEITAVNAGAVLQKLLQISMGVVYSSTKGVVDLKNDIRLEQLVTDVESCDEKVIIFVPFTHALNAVHKRLTDEGYEAAIIDGSVPKGQRDKVFNLFQNTNRYKAIVAHPGTMAHGLTLTAATCIIWYGPTTSLETFEQANARIRRIGQTKKQLFLMYQSTAAERKIYAKLRQAQQIQDNILDLFAANTEQ